MNKSDIQKFRIDIISGQETALSMTVCRDGTLARQGNGLLPADNISVHGSSDGVIFNSLIDILDENIFPHADVYDHPDKTGIPITYSVVFLDSTDNTAVFEFRFGSETADVGELLPFFDGFIARAVSLSDNWYTQEKSKLASDKSG